MEKRAVEKALGFYSPLLAGFEYMSRAFQRSAMDGSSVNKTFTPPIGRNFIDARQNKTIIAFIGVRLIAAHIERFSLPSFLLPFW